MTPPYPRDGLPVDRILFDMILEQSRTVMDNRHSIGQMSTQLEKLDHDMERLKGQGVTQTRQLWRIQEDMAVLRKSAERRHLWDAILERFTSRQIILLTAAALFVLTGAIKTHEISDAVRTLIGLPVVPFFNFV